MLLSEAGWAKRPGRAMEKQKGDDHRDAPKNTLEGTGWPEGLKKSWNFNRQEEEGGVFR